MEGRRHVVLDGTKQNLDGTWQPDADREPEAVSRPARSWTHCDPKKVGEFYELRGLPQFINWIHGMQQLQAIGYGVDTWGLEGEEFAEYVRFNALALMTEMGELLQEVPWKPWVTTRGRPDEEHRVKALGEAVDVLHFLGNILAALRVTDEELTWAYRDKMRRNIERQKAGYTGSDKCSKCGRAPDDTPRSTV